MSGVTRAIIAAHTMRIPAGTTLGEYEVLALIGSGGMGEVYRARDLRLKRDVAVKVIKLSLSGDTDAVARFRREAEAASALNHPNIVTVHGFGEAALPDGTRASYMVVELIEGRTLRELLNDRAVPRRELLRYCAQAAEGLSKAHAAGIVHRDLKPDNIMVTPDGYAKILDFGLAKLHEKPASSHDEATEKLRSQSGAMIGTVGYIAPEQVRGRAADTRSDIFALGCILYEAVTGKRAFEADSQFDVLSKIVYDEPPPITGAPQELTRLVMRCLDKSPDERYQSARDLAIDLRRSADVSSAQIATTSGRDVRSPLWILGLIVIAVVIALLVWRQVPSPVAPMHAIVILPFSNVSRDPSVEYLSDGITDALLNDVSRATSIRVIARTTAFRYRNTSKELPVIGRELGVDGIVAGQVRRIGEQLLVDAELVDAKDGTRLWGRHYERNATDMLAVEREMLGELAGVLGGKRTVPATENRVAYDLYLKGRYFWNKRTAESVTKALDLFQQAIDADPTYARAYSGVADCYIALNQLGGTRQQSCTRGEAAARRALELDESIAEAHTSLGYLDLSCELDLKAADRELRRALELSPNYAQAQHWYGLYLTNLGRANEGLPHVREAARLDPFSTQIAANLAYATWYAGQRDEAVKLANDAIELDRNAPYPYHMRGYIALAAGDYPTAIRYLQMAIDRKLMVSLPFLAYTYARSGDAAAVRRTLTEIDQSKSDAARTPALRAGTLAALGERDAAFASLEKALQERDFWLSELHISPPFDPLRDDPRFIEFVKKVDAR